MSHVQRAGQRANHQSFFLAAKLADYQQRHEMSDLQLADLLGCSLDNLARLRLCRTPATSQEIATIAACGHVDARSLTSILLELLFPLKETALVHPPTRYVSAPQERMRTMTTPATLTCPVQVLAVAFCPDFKLGPDTGRMYALIKKGERFFPLVFVNSDLYQGETLFLNHRGVLFLAPNDLLGGTGDGDDEGHECWKSEGEAREQFTKQYTQQVYGYLVEEWERSTFLPTP